MRFIKKLFKHGRSLALVIPAEFTQLLDSEEVILDMGLDKENNPQLIIKPTNELDAIEEDPLFMTFIQTVYKNALEHSEQLKGGSEIFNERVKKLIEGVPTDEEE